MTVHFFNIPVVKNGIKNSIGAVTFFGGIAVLYRTKEDSTLNKVVKISLLLSCIASRPGQYLCEKAILLMASPATLEKIFGKNTIFEINPWHPRHILNISANALAASALLKYLFDRNMNGLVALGIFNFATGRSTLHLLNDLWYAAARTRRA